MKNLLNAFNVAKSACERIASRGDREFELKIVYA